MPLASIEPIEGRKHFLIQRAGLSISGRVTAVNEGTIVVVDAQPASWFQSCHQSL